MFRFLSGLFLAIIVLNLAVAAWETRRVWVIGDIILKRKTNPIGYWIMTLLWSLVALGGVAGIPFLLYHALMGSGPYRDHAFFSLHQAWPYGLTVVVFGWLAIRIVKDRLFQLRHRTREHAA